MKPDGLPRTSQDDTSDEIEIVEVIGVDESGVETASSEPNEEDDEIEIVFDLPGEDDGAGSERPSATADATSDGPATPEAEEVDRERFLRLHADFENLKKRFEREKDDYVNYATAGLIERLLPVLDNFDRAILASDAGDDATATFRQGFELIYRQLHDELRRHGLRAVEAEAGLAFDPEVHEAVETVEPDADESEDGERAADGEDGVIVAELQRGYFLRDRLLRPALVRVRVGGAADDGLGES